MAIPLKDLLSRSIREAGVAPQVEAAMICNAFDAIAIETLGEVVRDQAKALYVKNKTLSVAAANSSIGQEIKLHEQEMLEKMAKKVGSGKVERLRFLV